MQVIHVSSYCTHSGIFERERMKKGSKDNNKEKPASPASVMPEWLGDTAVATCPTITTCDRASLPVDAHVTPDVAPAVEDVEVLPVASGEPAPNFDELPPVEFCPRCNGGTWWWDVLGNRHCANCGRNKLAASDRLLRRAARIRAGASRRPAARSTDQGGRARRRRAKQEDGSPGVPPPRRPPLPGCKHTLHHGDPGSTWQLVRRGDRQAVACCICGAFYGYLREQEATA
jgi:hypothetical protein